MAAPIVLIGVGNEYRGDDGVGLIALRELAKKELPNTRCIESNGDGTALLEAWTNAGVVILIDAASSKASPGMIYRFDALASPIPVTFSSPSSHAFGVAEAIELARTLQQLPPRLIVYAIEGKDFTAGPDLSVEVEEALHEVVERVAHEISDLHGVE
jgi:hydrogenase maturation protease